jgi:hypothetical protein
MAVDTTVPRSRRALLGAAIGAIAATAAQALGRPIPTRAANGDPLYLGQSNTATSLTQLTNLDFNCLVVGAGGSYAGIRGTSVTGRGVWGSSGGEGVFGEGGIGVRGLSNTGIGVKGRSDAAGQYGVYGENSVIGGYGVHGHNIATGTTGYLGGNNGVLGEHPGAGNAVVGSSASGIGVVGESLADSGPTKGVVGLTFSPDGIGVSGVAAAPFAFGVVGHNSTSDTYGRLGGNNGVLGEHPGAGNAIVGSSASGIGVVGESLATSGATRGVEGLSFSPDGYGVVGSNGADSGGAGVYGGTAATAGETAGVIGQVVSGDGYGVLGDTQSEDPAARAIVGHAPAGTGVLGWSGIGATPAGVPKTGVYGRATQDANARGVHGYSTAGRGVYGQATSGRGVYGYAGAANGVGVYAAAATTASAALQVAGIAKFSRSGKLTIPANATSATKTGVALTSTSLVLAVLQSNRAGVFVQAAVPNVGAGSFTVYLNKVASATANTTVAWFVVN